MKVIFLDVDGVLNTRPGSLDAAKLQLLTQIVQETGAQIVLSSTWRKHQHLKNRLQSALSARALKLYSSTPVLEYEEYGLMRARPRGEEIRAWLDENPHVSQFVILDDDPNMVTLKPLLVQTQSDTGLTPDLARECIRRLNE